VPAIHDAPPGAARTSLTGAGGSSYSRDRTIALSDGVFAIAITLLVLEVVPDIAGSATGRQLADELLAMAPKLAAYFLSFLVIGRLWDTHRGLFGHIHLADSRVVWANLWVLLWITLIPATAALLGSHLWEPTALTLYAANLLLTFAAVWVLWRRASSAGYVRRDGLHARTDQYIDRFVAVSLLGFALAIPAAFLSPPVALALVFLTTAFARAIANRILTATRSPEGGPARGGEEQAGARVDEER
jgi:TMEM175 potassium channel family protein